MLKQVRKDRNVHFQGWCVEIFLKSTKVQQTFGFSAKRWKNSDKPNLSFNKLRYHSVAERCQNDVEEFFERDDVS